MDEVLAQSGIFQGLSEDAVSPVASRLEMITLPRGRVVFNEGEPGDSLYIVVSGKIKLSRRERASGRGAGRSFISLGGGTRPPTERVTEGTAT